MTSNMELRVVRMMVAEEFTPSAMTGMIICFQELP